MITARRWNVVALLFAAAVCCGCDGEDPAVARATAMIERYPEKPQAYNQRGVAYEELGHFQEAIADYDRAIKFQPDAPNYYFNRANT